MLTRAASRLSRRATCAPSSGASKPQEWPDLDGPRPTLRRRGSRARRDGESCTAAHWLGGCDRAGGIPIPTEPLVGVVQ